MLTWHPSAFDKANTRSASGRACARLRPANSATAHLPAGVDHIDPFESRGRRAVTHRIRLSGLAFTVGEGDVHLVGRLAPDHVHRIPAVGCTGLICHILQHSRDLPT